MAQIPSKNTAAQTIRVCAWYHHAALGNDPGTRGLQSTFLTTLTAWQTAEEAVVAAERAAVAPRVELRFAETALEVVLGDLFSDAGKASAGDARSALFPDGKDAETRPRGAAQHARTRGSLLPRLDKYPGALRDQYLPLVTAATDRLGAAIAARTAAAQATAGARAGEDVALDDLIASFRSNLGAITQLFPKSPPLRDRFFHEFRESTAGDTGGGDKDPTPA